MLIGEVARRSGVPAKTLRYYEDIGLVDAPARSASGYRDYDEAVLDRLGFVRAAQAIGLSLGEIRSIVALRDDGQTPCGHVLGLLRARAEDIRRTIRQLRALQSELDRLVERAEDLDPADCDPQRVCHLIGPG
ncbi:MAG: heavy metal-responsive transcriptional regulator [Acidimicrobiales bacterium]